MTVVAFILGCMFGGLIGIGFLCCLQLNQNREQKEKKD